MEIIRRHTDHAIRAPLAGKPGFPGGLRLCRHPGDITLTAALKAMQGHALQPIPPDATAQKLLDVARNLDECLLNRYREILDPTFDEEVREVSESLLRAERRDENELKRIKATGCL